MLQSSANAHTPEASRKAFVVLPGHTYYLILGESFVSGPHAFCPGTYASLGHAPAAQEFMQRLCCGDSRRGYAVQGILEDKVTKWLSFGVCESLDATLRPYAQRPREDHLFTRDGCLGPRDARCLQPPCHVPFIKNCMLSATKAANRGQNGFQEESATPLIFLRSWGFRI